MCQSKEASVDAKGLFSGYQKNMVFDTEKYDELIESLTEKVGKEPLVYCDKYNVSKNEYYGVTPYSVNICWVYLNRSEEWINQVSQSNIGKKLIALQRECSVELIMFKYENKNRHIKKHRHP